MRKGQSLQQMVLGKLDVHKKNEKWILVSYTKNQKWIKYLKTRSETVKLFEKTQGEILDIGQMLSWILHQNTSNRSKNRHMGLDQM